MQSLKKKQSRKPKIQSLKYNTGSPKPEEKKHSGAPGKGSDIHLPGDSGFE